MTDKMTITGDFEVSDGAHTMDELYEHRMVLWIALCRHLEKERPGLVWRSEYHAAGSNYHGWFVLGYRQVAGKQITYHLPIREWGATSFATRLERSPEYDGHTSSDTLIRLRGLTEGML